MGGAGRWSYTGAKAPAQRGAAHVSLGVSNETVVTTRYWHVLDDGQIQCDVCPRHCRLREGQRGLCFVRARQDDQIVLTTSAAISF